MSDDDDRGIYPDDDPPRYPRKISCLHPDHDLLSTRDGTRARSHGQ